MKTIFQQLICVLLLCGSMNIFGQTGNFEKETAALNCFYNAFRDNGAKFKNIIQNAETTLIENKLLRDSSGESYLNFFRNLKKIESSDVKSLGIQDYIIKFMIGTNEFDKSKFEPCVKALRNSKGFTESRMNENTNFIKSIRENKVTMSITEIQDEILKRFTAKDFTHDYYKLIAFTFIEAYHVKPTVEEVDLNKKPSTKEMETALIIELTEEDVILIKNKKMTLQQLNGSVKTYLQTDINAKIIAFKISKSVLLKFYIKVEDEVNKVYWELRNQLSIKKYNSVYNELKFDQKVWIDREFPVKIIDIIK